MNCRAADWWQFHIGLNASSLIPGLYLLAAALVINEVLVPANGEYLVATLLTTIAQ